MKYVRLFSIALSVPLLTLLALTGCGVPQGDYDALLAQKTTLENEKQTLQTQLNNLQSEKDALVSENNALESERDTLEIEQQNLQEDYTQLDEEYNILQTEKESLENQFDDVNNELEEIQSVYPPRDFISSQELEDWLLNNDVSDKPITATWEGWYHRALEVQSDALIDGFIISADYDSTDQGVAVFCVTVINEVIWYWDPETDDIVRGPQLE